MQRVALARSLVYEPQLLLLDEPLSNLDAKLRLRLRDELRRIIKTTGVTALYVTHDQAEAVVLGDRIGVMRDGKLLQMAPAGRALQSAGRPVRRELHRRLEPAARHGAGAQRRARHHRLGAAGRIEAWTPQPLSAGDKARVALRAENVRLGERGPANVFSGRVIERRYQGMQTVYDVERGRPAHRGARARHGGPPRAERRGRHHPPARDLLGLSRRGHGGRLARDRLTCRESSPSSASEAITRKRSSRHPGR